MGSAPLKTDPLSSLESSKDHKNNINNHFNCQKSDHQKNYSSSYKSSSSSASSFKYNPSEEVTRTFIRSPPNHNPFINHHNQNQFNGKQSKS